MDTDIFWKGSSAVASARIWIAVFSWIALIVGAGCALFSFETTWIITGIALIGSAITGFIIKAILRGFETIVIASEAYLKDRQDLKDKNERKAE